MTGIALGWMAQTGSTGSVVRKAKTSHVSRPVFILQTQVVEDVSASEKASGSGSLSISLNQTDL